MFYENLPALSNLRTRSRDLLGAKYYLSKDYERTATTCSQQQTNTDFIYDHSTGMFGIAASGN